MDEPIIPPPPSPEVFKRAQDAMRMMIGNQKPALIQKIEFIEEELERTVEMLETSHLEEDREYLRVLRREFLQAIGELK